MNKNRMRRAKITPDIKPEYASGKKEQK